MSEFDLSEYMKSKMKRPTASTQIDHNYFASVAKVITNAVRVALSAKDYALVRLIARDLRPAIADFFSDLGYADRLKTEVENKVMLTLAGTKLGNMNISSEHNMEIRQAFFALNSYRYVYGLAAAEGIKLSSLHRYYSEDDHDNTVKATTALLCGLPITEDASLLHPQKLHFACKNEWLMLIHNIACHTPNGRLEKHVGGVSDFVRPSLRAAVGAFLYQDYVNGTLHEFCEAVHYSPRMNDFQFNDLDTHLHIVATTISIKALVTLYEKNNLAYFRFQDGIRQGFHYNRLPIERLTYLVSDWTISRATLSQLSTLCASICAHYDTVPEDKLFPLSELLTDFFSIENKHFGKSYYSELNKGPFKFDIYGCDLDLPGLANLMARLVGDERLPLIYREKWLSKIAERIPPRLINGMLLSGRLNEKQAHVLISSRTHTSSNLRVSDKEFTLIQIAEMLTTARNKYPFILTLPSIINPDLTVLQNLTSCMLPNDRALFNSCLDAAQVRRVLSIVDDVPKVAMSDQQPEFLKLPRI